MEITLLAIIATLIALKVLFDVLDKEEPVMLLVAVPSLAVIVAIGSLLVIALASGISFGLEYFGIGIV